MGKRTTFYFGRFSAITCTTAKLRSTDELRELQSRASSHLQAEQVISVRLCFSLWCFLHVMVISLWCVFVWSSDHDRWNVMWNCICGSTCFLQHQDKYHNVVLLFFAFFPTSAITAQDDSLKTNEVNSMVSSLFVLIWGSCKWSCC